MGSYGKTLPELKQAIAYLSPKEANKKVLIYLTKQLTQEIQSAAHATVPSSLMVSRSSLPDSSSNEPNSQSAASHGKRLRETDSPEDSEGMKIDRLTHDKRE